MLGDDGGNSNVSSSSSSSGGNLSIPKEAVAGMMSGFVSRFTITPLDVLKIRFQLQLGNEQTYVTVLQSLNLIGREEGVLGLWKGSVPAISLWMLYSGIQFPVYEQCKVVCSGVGFGKDESNFLSGSLAALVATSVSYPLDIIRTHMVFNEKKSDHPTKLLGLVRKTYQTDGIVGFYRGFIPTLMQVIPNMALSFTLYDFFKRITPIKNVEPEGKSHNKDLCLRVLYSLFTGGCAGLFSKLAVHPLDTIKKRLQVNHMYHFNGKEKYNGTLHCIKNMIQEEGVLSLYKGTVPTVLKSTIATAITFTSYDYFMSRFS